MRVQLSVTRQKEIINLMRRHHELLEGVTLESAMKEPSRNIMYIEIILAMNLVDCLFINVACV